MCDPLTLLLGVGSIAGSLLGGSNKPPEPELPAPPAPMSKQPGATVRVGTRDQKTKSTATDYEGFTEKRKAGTALGNVGRSGLTI